MKQILLLIAIWLNLNAYSQMKEVATIGGGCFWCIEAYFSNLQGVESVVSGYSGGDTENPTYKEVCSGNTGHAEVVQITYDQYVIDFVDILEVFFAMHDPTTLNRQGADAGTQYRSVIFYHSSKQKEVAQSMITEMNKLNVFSNPIVTQVEPLGEFYPAEDYHQDYYKNNPSQSYCRFVIDPKMDKLKKMFKERLKE